MYMFGNMCSSCEYEIVMKIFEKVVAFELTISSLCEESGCNFKEKKRKKNREAKEELTVWYIPGGTRY